MAYIKIPRICRTCEKHFSVTPSKMRQGVCNFCSRKCFYASFDRPIEERFWERVNKTDTCWVWTGNTNYSGYGIIKHNGKMWRAHRLSYLLANGICPDNLFVCHKCDNPPCIRPDHLFLGTNADNVRDMINKGRNRTCSYEKKCATIPHGEDSPNAKLTEADVRDIRARCKPGQWVMRKIAKEYNVHRITIQKIVYRRTWKHLE